MTTHHGYGREMRSRLLAGLVLPIALSFAVAGCGAESSTTGADGPTRTAGTTGTTVEIVRTGGIAGVRDIVKIAPDGNARVTTRDGRGRVCHPAAKALSRLRALDLAAAAAEPSTAGQMADGFNYSVRIGHQRASASEGDKGGRRVDIVNAAAAVLTSCLAGSSVPRSY